MSVIVATITQVKGEDLVNIASDTQSNFPNDFSLDCGKKFGLRGSSRSPYFIGITGSFRVSDLFLECKDLPEVLESNDDVRDLRDILVRVFDAEAKRPGSGGANDLGFDALVACSAGLFTIYADFQLSKAEVPYAAVGTGAEAAYGALFAISRGGQAQPSAIQSIRAACNFRADCGGQIKAQEFSIRDGSSSPLMTLGNL